MSTYLMYSDDKRDLHAIDRKREMGHVALTVPISIRLPTTIVHYVIKRDEIW